MNIISSVGEASALLKKGSVLAYPTEAVYGLGCDPFNQDAVEKIAILKHRSMSKGLILLIADWSQLTPLIGFVTDEQLKSVRATWPGPVTWIFPKSSLIPEWLSGQHDGIAIRMTAHPVARALCSEGPVVSTSANISGHEPVVDLANLQVQFPQGVDAVLAGDLGGLCQPSSIFDVRSGIRLR